MPSFQRRTKSSNHQPDIVEARVIGPPAIETAGTSGVLEANSSQEMPAARSGPPCAACGAPRDAETNFCTACGAPLTNEGPAAVSAQSDSPPAALPSRTFQCQNCGSEVATSVDQRSYICPFCDSSYVIEIPSQRGRQRPEFVIGFAITAAQAKEKYFEWLGRNAWFRPGDLAERAIAEKQKGVYLPFWHFSMHAQSDWSANIGEYWYRTETYTTKDSKGNTVTRTRQVRETEWFPLRGHYQRYYHGFMVPATKGITQQEASAIQPFQLASMARYRPYFLAGWMAEEYSIGMDQAIEQSQDEFRGRLQQEVQRFLPGDTSSGLAVNTRFEVNGSDLVLLPVHVLSYRYRDRNFRFLVNGQTGKIVGQKPWSTKRITAVVISLIVLLAALVAAVIFIANR